MTALRRITVEVDAHVAEQIDAKVAAGEYSDPAAYVLESVVTHLLDQDPETERWLRENVVPTLERMDREGPANLSAEQVFGQARERFLAGQKRA